MKSTSTPTITYEAPETRVIEIDINSLVCTSPYEEITTLQEENVF